jgi:cyclophilin family peptidyl-prolyl cis-trans isomerase
MRILALALPLLFLGLAGCTEPDDGNGTLVENSCTEHPNYGGANPHVRLETNLGNITAEIFVDKVPNTGMNFVKLAEAGTLDDSPFHRIITNFMMQGGDHTLGNGRGGEAHPDCADAQGNIADEFHADLKHDGKGVLSMANAGPNTGSSQFFITFAPTSWLDGKHAVFGQVTDGMDTVDKVNAQAASQSGAPRVPVTLVKATVDWS